MNNGKNESSLNSFQVICIKFNVFASEKIKWAFFFFPKIVSNSNYVTCFIIKGH